MDDPILLPTPPNSCYSPSLRSERKVRCSVTVLTNCWLWALQDEETTTRVIRIEDFSWLDSELWILAKVVHTTTNPKDEWCVDVRYVSRTEQYRWGEEFSSFPGARDAILKNLEELILAMERRAVVSQKKRRTSTGFLSCFSFWLGLCCILPSFSAKWCWYATRGILNAPRSPEFRVLASVPRSYSFAHLGLLWRSIPWPGSYSYFRLFCFPYHLYVFKKFPLLASNKYGSHSIFHFITLYIPYLVLFGLVLLSSQMAYNKRELPYSLYFSSPVFN